MNLLLDTHALLWWLAGEGMSAEGMQAIEDSGTDVFVSAASVWEISIKRAMGKLRTGDDLLGAIAASGFAPLPISLEHAEIAGSLPSHHLDPFDRMLIAQAQVLGLVIVTRDRAFEQYQVQRLRC